MNFPGNKKRTDGVEIDPYPQRTMHSEQSFFTCALRPELRYLNSESSSLRCVISSNRMNSNGHARFGAL